MRRPPRPRSPLTLAWLAALWLGLACNWPLWQAMAALPDASTRFIITFTGIVIAVQGALLSLVAAWRVALKPVLTVVLVSAAAGAYFMSSYGIVIDPTMIVNILQTDVHEAGDLLNLRMLGALLLLAGLPLLWLWRQPLEDARWTRRLGFNLLGFAAGIALAAALVMSSFAQMASTMRNHKPLRYMINPVTSFYSLGAVAARAGASPKGPPEVIGADARLAPRAEGQDGAKPPLLLFVVGETARAANFSLLGYGRDTNPLLAKLPVLAFSKVDACGTSTAASLPCMFSHLGREKFVDLKGGQENLLDVLQRAGLAVLWIDNQSGCKGVCERVPHVDLCDGDECMDTVMLDKLDERIAALDPERVKRGVVLLMHQMGSHGPAYYKRSPADGKPFTPECTSNALQQCPREQVVNAYDNSIAYTDRLLAGAIAWLQTQEHRFSASLLYVSDHGESLGENNIYLHGMPYAFAPREQIHVPMIVWLGQDLAPASNCLKSKLAEPLSHDNLFHTVIGLAGVQTSVYKPEWDFIQPCR